MSQPLIQQYFNLRLPALQPGTSSTTIAVFSVFIDLLISYSLLLSDFSVSYAHNAGFLAAGCFLVLLRLAKFDASGPDIAGNSPSSKTFSVISYFLVQSAIRAGCIASLVHFSFPETLAPGAGILLATVIGSYSSALLLTRNTLSSNWLTLGLILTVCVLTLRLVFLGAMEVIPQEAYYWNYARHLSPGYLDHPPLIAATIWSGEWLFGHSYFGTRIGPFIYGILFLLIFYRYARLQVDKNTAVFACLLAVLLPYFFLGTGFLATPDASLTVAWVMALYFFYRALVNNHYPSWYGVGLAMGIGMLSKYTIVLLAPAAFMFIMVDAQARKTLMRKEPYLAVIIALLVFSPVIYWNAINDWASFAFQGGERFDAEPENFIGMMLTNIMAIVTPLPLLALPYLFVSKMTSQSSTLNSPFNFRVRLFIFSFLLLPLAVFAWNALKNEPRYNWTGPLWITLLPMLAWLIVHASQLRWKYLRVIFKKITVPFLIFLICIFSVFLQFLSIGLPGLKFPGGSARLLGWSEVTKNLYTIQQQLPADNQRVVIVGLDKYFITSKLAYHGTPAFLGKNHSLDVTGLHLLNDDSLMFAFWNPVEDYKNATLIMLGRSVDDVSDYRLKPYFDHLAPTIEPFPIYRSDFGLPGTPIREYYYRIGYGYKPVKP